MRSGGRFDKIIGMISPLSSPAKITPKEVLSLRHKNKLSIINGVPDIGDLILESQFAMEAFPLMHTILSESKKGKAEIKYDKTDSEIALFFRNKALELAKKCDVHVKHFGLWDYSPGDITYTDLYIDGVAFMGDEPGERLTNMDLWCHAFGDVLIGGLGIGMVICGLAENPNINSITVLENSRDVIDLVGPTIEAFVKNKCRLNIIEGDVFEYKSEKKFDTIYMDIWARLNPKNLPQYETLLSKYKSNLREYGWMECWAREFLQDVKKIRDES